MKRRIKKTVAGLTALACIASGNGMFSMNVFAQEPGLEIQELPEVPENYSEIVDKTDTLKTVFSGAYRVPVTVEETQERSVLVYLAEDYAQTQGFIMVVPDSGMTAEDVLLDGGWKALADENELFLMVLEPESPYDLEKEGADYAYVKAAAALAGTRDYWFMPKGRDYIAGYGDGASLALEYAQDNAASWAGVAAFGDPKIDTDAIENPGVELPVWMYVSDGAAASGFTEMFKELNDCTDEVYSSQDADEIYMPNQAVNDLLLNDQPMSQVRVTVTQEPAALDPQRTAAVYSFLKKGTREVGYGTKAMRYAHDLEDWGAEIKSVEIDGVTRFWVEYVPASLRKTSEEGAPLMLVLHGSALNGEYFAERSGIIRLAEENGFIVALPTGSIGSGISPVWNTSASEESWDDVGFISAMIEDIENRFPVDKSRVYCYGHSLGGMFTQLLASYLDGTFAAISGTGCASTKIQETAQSLTHEYKTPVYVIMGEKDMWDGSFDTEEAAFFRNYFTEYNDTLEDYGSYRSGRYQMYEWTDQEGVPMVRYAIVDDMPHTATLDNLMELYGWMSRFTRGEDGSVEYEAGIYTEAATQQEAQ